MSDSVFIGIDVSSQTLEVASSAQAKAAIRKLSPALLKGQPWPKSFAQIQKELKQ